MTPLGKMALGAQTLSEGSTLFFRGQRQLYLAFGDRLTEASFLREGSLRWRVAEIPARGGGLLAQVFDVPTLEVEAGFRSALHLVEKRLDNGVFLEAVGHPNRAEPGSVLRVVLKWRVEQLPPETAGAAYRFFIHLAPRPEAVQVAQENGIGYPTSRWAVGDGLLSWLEVRIGREVAPGDYYLRVGMYDLATMRRARFLDQDGVPQEDWRLMGSIRVE